MSMFLYKLWSKFLTAFGSFKVFSYPMFLVYDPNDYAVGGEQVLEIMKKIREGDIVLRGYDNYLDSKFIPDKLSFSHGAIYIGNNKIIHAVAEGVSETDIIDFTRCDRIAIFRPKSGQKKAIAKAKKFLKNKIPYDFGFQREAGKKVSALYCFELCSECYPKLNIPRKTVKKLFGLIQKKDVFLAESFFISPDMTCIYHYNPKFNLA